MINNPPTSAGDVGSVLPSEDLLEKERRNPTDRGAWRATVHGVSTVRQDLGTKQ